MTCGFGKAVWFGSDLTIIPDSIRPQNVIRWVHCYLNAGSQYQNVIAQLTIPVTVILYSIWYGRNQHIFNGIQLDVMATLGLARRWINEFTSLVNHSLNHASHHKQLQPRNSIPGPILLLTSLLFSIIGYQSLTS